MSKAEDVDNPFPPGCVGMIITMEISTGKVRLIAPLERKDFCANMLAEALKTVMLYVPEENKPKIEIATPVIDLRKVGRKFN